MISQAACLRKTNVEGVGEQEVVLDGEFRLGLRIVQSARGELQIARGRPRPRPRRLFSPLVHNVKNDKNGAVPQIRGDLVKHGARPAARNNTKPPIRT